MAVIVMGGFSLIFMTIFGYFAYVRYLSHNGHESSGEPGRDRKLLNRERAEQRVTG